MDEIIRCPQCGSTDIGNYDGMCVCFACRASFPAPKEPKAFHPMRLFISYGHPESGICRRIRDALTARGHDVWFDDTNIVHGEDWRTQIADGIAHSDGVISCLSRHSVRDPGVSLDELSIAIGVRGGNIKTILLESEKEVQPPASVCHIQWLDMSRWREMQEQGDEVFAPWFEAKMEQLFEVIESEESREFVGQITAIREKLHVNYDTSKQKDLLRRPFVGREWLTAQVEAWLDDAAGARLCVLYGDPGVGKSAFAARYMHYNPRVAAGLFCEYSRPLYNDSRTVIMTLAYLLACRLPNYRMVLAEMLEQEKRLGELTPSELFDLLLATPLASLVIDGGQETLCIVIDGLDECGQGERNALAEVLGQYAGRLPAWLRILATARDVAAVTGPLGEAFQMELRGEQEQNKEDIRQYFIGQLQEKYGADPAWPEALETLTERSGGIFLYAALAANGIRAGKVSIEDSWQFPEGLSGAFHQWFGWFFPDEEEYKREFRMPLGVLLAAPEALPAKELKRIFSWDDNEQNDFLRRVGVLLKRGTNDFGDETVSFSHQYLNEWLDTAEAGRYRSSRRAAMEQMAERFYALFREDKTAATHYEAVHMLGLLEESGQSGRRDELAVDHDLLYAVLGAGDCCRAWGKQDTALRCYEQARDMAQTAVEQKAPEGPRDLGVSYSEVAGILEEKGRLDEALTMSEKSMKISEWIVREQDTPENRRDLGTRYRSVASILHNTRQPDKALELCEKAIAIDEQLIREQDAPEYQGDLSVSYDIAAHILEAKGRLDEALELCEKAMAICERLAREQNGPGYQAILAFSYTSVAFILEQKGRLDEALTMNEKAMALWEQLDCEKNTFFYCWNFGCSCEGVAGVLEKKGQLDEALTMYEKLVAIREQLAWVQDTPKNWQDLSNSYAKAAGILHEKGQLDEALTVYEKLAAVREQLVWKQDTPENWHDLSSCYSQIAGILGEKGQLDEALELSEKAMAIRECLTREQDTPENRRDLSVIYNQVAFILRVKGCLDEALELSEKAMAIWEQLAREQNGQEYQKSLSICYIFAAFILEGKGRLDEALELSEKAMAISEQLTREQDTPENRKELGTSYDRAADILHEKGQSDEALALYEKSFALRVRLARERGTVNDYDALAVSCYDIATTAREPEKKTAYAKKGMEISQKLLDATGNERYQAFCRDFQRLLDNLK